MPVKRRKDRRKEAETLEKWDSVFASGYDFFEDLLTIGVTLDEYGRPPREVTATAWERLGCDFVSARDPHLGPSWAETEFGMPKRVKRAGKKT